MRIGWIKVRSITLKLSLLCLAAALFMPVAVFAETDSGLDVQLIADRKKAGPGGSVTYHLIYHNVTNQQKFDVKMKLFVPIGLEPEELGGGEWNAQLRLLQWTVKDVPENGAGVIHFNLKIEAGVKPGTGFDLVGTAAAGGEAVIQLPSVRLVAGTQLDQPFFDGYPDGKFHPESNLTRAETAAVIARIQNLELQNGKPVSYNDVDGKHWAHPYIVKVTQAGYMEGDNGRFRPDDPITRAELVTLVLRMRGVHEVPLVAFADAAGHWAQDIVGTAQQLRFVEGWTDARFGPDMPIRRDAAAKLINVGLSRGPLEDGETKVMQHFPDVAGTDWSFGWVEESSMVAHESEVSADGRERLIRYVPEQTEPF
jgi:hypothetical protein